MPNRGCKPTISHSLNDSGPRRLVWVGFALILLWLIGCSVESTPTAPPSPTATPWPTPNASLLIDTSIRAGPGREYDQTSPLAKGEAVNVLGKAWGLDCTEWVFVRTMEGDNGWLPPALISPTALLEQVDPAPTPTPQVWPTPMPETCTDGLSLVWITNTLNVPLDAYLWGGEPGLSLHAEPGEAIQVCIAPGQYCYTVTDGQESERGRAIFDAGHCTCWWWGRRESSQCRCLENPSAYRRP